MTHIYQIEGTVQPYAWGGHTYLAQLTRRSTPSAGPEAELWMGAHPKGPATVHLTDGESVSLPQLLQRHGQDILGEVVYRRFSGEWPFLFKVLDVRQMLSIQCHPNKKQAEAGFAREEEAGIPLSAPHRVFRDANHKPELSVALSDFYLLHGFLPIEQMADRILAVPEWEPLRPLLQKGIAGLYAHLMRMPQSEVDALLQPLANRLQAKPASAFAKAHPDHWARQALDQYARPDGSIDRGIFSIYLMQIVHLPPGEAVFQDAGILHAYLEGQVVEIMANSDNVMRGGLTPKHVDVDALLNHVEFTARPPFVVHGEKQSATTIAYPAPVSDFLLREIRLTPGHSQYTPDDATPAIYLVMEGSVSVDHLSSPLEKGDQFLVGHGVSPSIRANGSAARLFQATVPV